MSVKQKTVSMLLILLIISMLLYAILRTQEQDARGTPVTIGFIGPFAKERGVSTQAAVTIATEDINASGGINGRPLVVIYKDGNCESAAAAAAANELIQTHQVPAILGGLCSHETLAFTAMAEEAKTVVLSYCSLAAEITNAGDYIFRNTPSGVHLARFAAKYLRKVEKKERAAILYTDAPYGTTVADELAKTFTESGGEVVLKEPHQYSENNIDLKNQIAAMRETNPDIIYFLGYAGQLAPGMRQIRDAGIETPVFGGSEWDTTEAWREPATEGVKYIVTHARVTNDFENTMRNRFGITETIECAPQAYDGLKILAQTMRKVGNNPEDIKNALYHMNYTSDLSSNQTSFDSNGDIQEIFYIVKKIEDGISIKTEYYRTDQHGDYVRE